MGPTETVPGSRLLQAERNRKIYVLLRFKFVRLFQAPLKFVYALDGSETKNSVMMGRGVQQQVSRTAWDGDKLVITTTHSFANPATGKLMTQEVIQMLSLNSPDSLDCHCKPPCLTIRSPGDRSL